MSTMSSGAVDQGSEPKTSLCLPRCHKESDSYKARGLGMQLSREEDCGSAWTMQDLHTRVGLSSEPCGMRSESLSSELSIFLTIRAINSPMLRPEGEVPKVMLVPS